MKKYHDIIKANYMYSTTACCYTNFLNYKLEMEYLIEIINNHMSNNKSNRNDIFIQ